MIRESFLRHDSRYSRSVRNKPKQMKNLLIINIILCILGYNDALSQADLVLSVAEPTETEYKQLDFLSIAIEIQNIGNQVSQETNLLIYLTKDLDVVYEEIIGRVSIPVLEPNETRSIPYFYPLGRGNYTGDYFIGFNIDPENLVFETDENNLVCYTNENECGQIQINNSISDDWYSSLLPDPIILIHGLSDRDQTWGTTVNYLANKYGLNYGGSLSYCLNPDGDLSTSDDGLLIDYSDIDPNGVGDIFVLNFDISMLGEKYVSDDFIPFNDDFSNQAAIFRQGKAIKEAIIKVRGLTSKSNVVLVGHSMGGLAAREYLANKENWLDDGKHHVTKLLTLDTPHGGSNLNGPDLIEIFLGKDDSSEAIRDLRYYDLFNRGIYLEGGNEADFFSTNFFYNTDVNCNGSSNDDIIGLNLKPSPDDLSYACLISNLLDFGYDVVESTRADLNNYLYAPPPLISPHSDRWFINENHGSIKNNHEHLIKGLDESSWFNLSTKIELNSAYLGFISEQAPNSNLPQNLINKDFDDYAVSIEKLSSLEIDILNVSVNDLSVSIFDDNFNLVSSINNDANSILNLTSVLDEGDYYIEIESIPDTASWRYPYLMVVQSNELEPMIANYTVSESTICENDHVVYADISQGEANNYFWKFEGGNPSTSTERNPSVVYPTSGVFDVELEISNDYQNSVLRSEDQIFVQSIPDVAFDFEEVSNSEIQFNNTSTNTSSSTKYDWSFGDGNSSKEENPLHGYTSDGDFNVRLKIEDTCGTDSTSQEIKIRITSSNSIINEKTYKIYPNPTSSSVTIDSKSNLDIRIISVLGKVVYEGNIIKEKSKRINMEHLANGSYFIELERNGKKSTHTILKIEGL